MRRAVLNLTAVRASCSARPTAVLAEHQGNAVSRRHALGLEASGFRPHWCDRRRWAGGDQWPGWLGSLQQRARLAPMFLEEAALLGEGDGFVEVGAGTEMIA